jgi:RNA polymerase sigma-70 factor (ECF subfamily)
MTIAPEHSRSHSFATERDALSNTELVRFLRADPESAAPLLYQRFERRIRWIVRRMMGADHDQHDVVQQVFVDLVRSGFDLREPDKLPAWIHSITVCAVYKDLRRRRMYRTLEGASTVPVVRDFVRDVEARDLLGRAVAMIEHLPQRERSAFTMRIVEGRTFEEVAELTGCSIATIKRRFARANRRMLSMISRNAELMTLARRSTVAGAPFSKRPSPALDGAPASSN